MIPLVLLPVRNERHGGSAGPSYTQRASMDARNKALAFLTTHFEIVKRPLAEIGWQLGGDTQLTL